MGCSDGARLSDGEEGEGPHSTVITPFITIQWPGKGAEEGIAAFARGGVERDGEIVAGGHDVHVEENGRRCGGCNGARQRRARR